MEEKFIDIFTGLKRDYGYADINSAYKDPATGKLKLKYGWAAKELLESDYLDHLSGKKSIGIQPCDGGYQYKRMEVSGERYADKPDKNMYSHIHDALQYMMLGAGEGRALLNNQKQSKPVVASRDFNVFNKKPTKERRQGLWSRL